MKPYSEQIAKLPKWAQDHIRDLDFQRQQAVTALNEFVDQQKPTDAWIEDHPITGENSGPSNKRRYLASKSRHSQCRHPGRSLLISVRDMRIAPSASNSIEIWSDR